MISIGIQIHTQSIDRLHRADALDVQRLGGEVREGEQRRAEKKSIIKIPHESNSRTNLTCAHANVGDRKTCPSDLAAARTEIPGRAN